MVTEEQYKAIKLLQLSVSRLKEECLILQQRIRQADIRSSEIDRRIENKEKEYGRIKS